MANFEKAVIKTLINEGGSTLTNDPVDRGGLTRYGISQRSYPQLNILTLSESQAKSIYKKDYWDRIKGDLIPNQVIAEAIFDTAVLMGPRTASRLAQMTLNVKVDGSIGPNTLRALSKIDKRLFMPIFILSKISRYASICRGDPEQKKFLLGWINRALGGVS